MEETKYNDSELEQHSILRSLALSLLPGLLITIVIIVFSLLSLKKGLPHQFVIYIPTLLVVLPFELGYLLYLGKRKNGRYSLEKVVHLRSSLSIKQYLIFVPVLTAWNFLIFAVMAPLEKFFVDNLFYWMPSWLLPSPDPINDLVLLTTQYSKGLVSLVMIIGIVLNGIITPVVEELYFRGYLLPGLSRFKNWAPLLNVLFFSVYHLFSPWKYLTIILALLPAVYIVWKKKSIYLTIATHVILNTIGIASSIVYLLFML
jgi:membrane protease YdiL (CAAX protease family)